MAVDGTTPALDLGIDGLDDARRIGRGGFATVYAARDLDFDRWVAVKILDLIDDAGRRRFDREVRIMGRLSGHPHVITPYRSGYTRRGNPFVVMELITDGSLFDLIQREGQLGWTQAIDLMLPVADALGHAHHQGINHRDVKPANILIANGQPQLSDFGLAAVQGGYGTSEIALSLQYSPPETFNGTDDGRDQRSDLYSLAATLYTLIAGRPPFSGNDDSPGALMRRVEFDLPPPIADVPARLNEFFLRALAKNPSERPPDAASLAEELIAIRTRPPVAPRSERPREEPTDPTSHRSPSPGLVPVAVDDDDRVSMARGFRLAPAASSYRRVGAGSIAVFVLLAAGLFTLVRLSDPPVANLGPTAPTVISAGPEVAGHELQPRAYPQGAAVWEIVALSDGQLVAAAESEVRVWDPGNPTSSTSAFSEHTAPVRTLLALADGRIASAGSGGTIRLWDPEEPSRAAAVYTGHREQVHDLAQLADGRIASTGPNGPLQLWNPDDLDQVEALSGPYTGAWSLVVLGDGRLATGSEDHLLRIMDPDEPDQPPLVLAGHESVIIDLAVLGDGRLVSAALDSTVRLWDLANPNDPALVYRGHSGPVQTVVGLPDGRVASAGADLMIHIWDPDDLNATPLILAGHSDAITSLAVLPDGQLASAGADGTVHVWDLDEPDR